MKEYEATYAMVDEIEGIVRTIEDEKGSQEERERTRDVWARIEGLEKDKVSASDTSWGSADWDSDVDGAETGPPVIERDAIVSVGRIDSAGSLGQAEEEPATVQ